MRNKEKAKDIAQLCARCIESNGHPCSGCMECEARGTYYGALEMAEWKDEQMRQMLDREIDRANKYYDDNLSSVQMNGSIRAVHILSELLGEEFPYDRLHMSFATMD